MPLHVDLKTSGYKLSRIDRERLDAAIDHLDRLTDTYQVRTLHATIEKFGHSDECNVRMVLMLGGRRLIAYDHGPAVATVVQQCVDVIGQKIELAKERVHRAHGERRVRRAKEEAAAPDLEAARAARARKDPEGFVTALDGVPEAIEAEIGRRLKYHPDAEALLGDEVLIADLVDSVLLWAYRNFETRPENVPFRDWLYKAIDPAIDAVVHAIVGVPSRTKPPEAA